jgi:succinate-semialdehyde dehydrogenase / glutarate-semialdehyde dehydrogenase
MPYQTINPFNGEVLCTFEEYTDAQMQALLTKADDTFRNTWSKLSVQERCKVLGKAAKLMHDQKEELARLATLEMGKRIAESRGELELCMAILQYYADNAEKFLAPTPIQSTLGTAHIEYEPLGVLLGVQPWNYPYYQLARFAAPHLASGNTMLVKHAPSVPQCALAFERILLEAGAPEGAYINVFLSNDQADVLIEDPRIRGVALTGSEKAGSVLASIAGKNLKKSTMELGGSDAFIVLEDCDLEFAVKMAVVGRLGNAGQTCIGAKRFIFVGPRANQFLEGFSAALEQLKPGDPFDEATTLGPLCSEVALERLVAQIKEAVAHGARVHTGGNRIDRPGAFMQPTILTNITRENPAYTQEFFGPVALFFTAKDENEAIEIANDSPYGLGGSIYTKDIEHGKCLASKIHTGMVFINYPSLSAPDLPFGGIKRSGYGKELANLGIEEFVNKKLICVATSPSLVA